MESKSNVQAEPGSQHAAGRAGSQRLPLILAFLSFVAVVPYLNTLLNGFVYDDGAQVVGNPYIRSFRYLPQIFTSNVWSFRGQEGVSNYYRPLMTLGYLICYKLFGPLAYGFHLANILMNTLVVIALFLVTRRLFNHEKLAMVAACIFALHPIHTEAVAWVASITEPEVAFFYLLAFWCFLEVARPGGKRSGRFQLAMCVCFALAILSKEQAVTLALLATIYEHGYRDDRRETTWGQKFGRYGLLWLMDAGYILLRIHLLGSFAPLQWWKKLTWYETGLTAVALTGRYLGKLLWPAQLNAYYVFDKSSSLLETRVLLGLVGITLTAAIFLALWRKQRLVSFGMVWFFATLAPVLDARLMAGNVFTERYLYLPSVGFAWLAAWAGIWCWEAGAGRERWARSALVGATCVLGALAMIRVVTRNRVWRSDMVLYKDTLKVSPRATAMMANLGVVYWNMHDLKDARYWWRKALDHDPKAPILINNVGLIYMREKNYREAAAYFHRAFEHEPRYADAHLNLGIVYRKMGEDEAAELQFRAAALLSPDLPDPHTQLGELYLKHGKVAQAEEQFRLSVRAFQTYRGEDGLGDVYVKEGRSNRAAGAYHRAIALNEFDDRAHFALAALLAARGQRAAAIKEYERGFMTNPRDAQALASYRKLTSQTSNDKP